METKKKKKILNAVMVIVILAIICAGSAAVISIRGGSSAPEEAEAVCIEKTGVATLERKGVSFNLEKDMALEEGDIVRTKDKAEAELLLKGSTIFLNENTQLRITSLEEKKALTSLDSGEIFVVSDTSSSCRILELQNFMIESEGAVFSASSRTGSGELNVLSGKIKAISGETEIEVKSGQKISISGDKGEVDSLKAEYLSNFAIERAIEKSGEEKLCFNEKELKKIMEDRQKEADKAAQESQSSETISDSENEKAPQNSVNNQESSSSSGSDEALPPSDSKTLSCTIEIRCDTILNNMEKLKAGKEGYVPSDGVILRTTEVKFTQGETAFDILKRACSSRGIQLEYKASSAYGTSYVQGINNLYEYDCGNTSGWLYKVNGWFPDYGASNYRLKDGDVIVFCYSCSQGDVK